jgi:Domain of unknown function (DUF932)
MAGLFRVVCANGLVTTSKLFDRIRIPHTGDVMPKVIDGTHRVLEEATRQLSVAEQWTHVILNPDDQLALATAAHQLRFDGPTPIQPKHLLHVRRPEDAQADLWSVFNRVQENTIRGGLRINRRTMRAVNGIDENVRINRALWEVAEAMS